MSTPDDDGISANEKEVLDEGPKAIILSLINQAKKGMDLHRITLPTFVLEPRSMLEKLTDFMSFPELIINAQKSTDDVERFINVVRFYISGWHIRPKGVKKPYNSILGEIFRCKWTLPDGSTALYIAEQVSHHPPISAYFYANPANHVIIMGTINPTSRFLGTSAATIMKGMSKVLFTDRPGEEYLMTMPNVYAKGILFGTMYMELGDSVTIKCPKNNLTCEIDFKTKGFFSGSHNRVVGKIKSGDKNVLRTFDGKWTEKVDITTPKGKTENESTVEFLDVSKLVAVEKIVAREDDQEERESRRLWRKLTEDLLKRDFDSGTEEKTRIENLQRAEAKLRAEENVEWTPRFFRRNPGEDNFFSFVHLHLDKGLSPEDLLKYYEDVIFSSPKPLSSSNHPNAN